VPGSGTNTIPARRPQPTILYYHLLFVERGDWEDDPNDQRAPLPVHERSWRHPSEIGATHWIRTEPPLVVGRGLCVATGTVGAVLAIGLLWLMIPHQSHGEVAAEVSSMPVRTAVRTAAETLAARATNVPSPTAAPLVTRPSAPATTAVPSPTTTVRAGVASTTVVLSTETFTATQPALAVALAPGHFVVTTAAAVAGRTVLDVHLSTGDVVAGTVVLVDATSGIAVVSLATNVAGSALEPSNTPVPNAAAIVMTPEPTRVGIWADETGTQIGYNPDWVPVEGSLVLDGDGRLMGMCTMTATGAHLVGVLSMIEAVNTAASNEAAATTAPAWLGIDAEVGANAAITVVYVFLSGPAGRAGIQSGDVIRAVDGVAIAGLDALRAGISSRAVGEQVVLSVVKAGTTDPVDVTVSLTARQRGSL